MHVHLIKVLFVYYILIEKKLLLVHIFFKKRLLWYSLPGILFYLEVFNFVKWSLAVFRVTIWKLLIALEGYELVSVFI